MPIMVVTGAGRGIGAAIARAAARDGWHVIVNYNRSKQKAENVVTEIEADGGRALAIQADISQEDQVLDLFRQIDDALGPIDAVINNAAIDPKVKGDQGVMETSRLENFPLEQWDLQIAVGLTGAFLCSQVFGSAMAQDGKGGVILNIASDLSII